MSAADHGVVRETLELEQPDGNFSDEPPTEEELALAEKYRDIDEQRMANRVGPSHPRHDLHQHWLEERGLGPEWDKQRGY